MKTWKTKEFGGGKKSLIVSHIRGHLFFLFFFSLCVCIIVGIFSMSLKVPPNIIFIGYMICSVLELYFIGLGLSAGHWASRDDPFVHLAIH